ncbi:hypothetical protein GOP47_0021173 [Adiantum capillus-veneris]|uniref:Stress-response A/B barrel domain-containing protein n=1 Tax=Adiantum capillus-veneris TaxID=13818 RepID=A0A9D4UBK7_ADICA|nr:hypothetical protein GOP47_0021173 [Adiantum capillus-veneris]
MAASVVEHVVLFKAKESASQAALKACISRFRALAELEAVVYLHAGAIRTCQPEDGAWTHMLYGRYKDKAALHAYAKHPAHVHAVALADPLFQDKMALDWEAPAGGTPAPCPHIGNLFFAAVHIIFVQWMHHPHAPQLETTLCQALATSLPSSLISHTCGPNFSPDRARGFHWGFAALFSTCSTPQEDGFLEILTQNLSIRSFLCIDFVTDNGISSRM